jgi:hypothetical protein
VIFTLLALTLAAPFPLPAIDGKPLAVVKDQKVFRVPLGFERVKAFYTEQLGKQAEVTLRESSASGTKTLTISTTSKGESWKRAVIRQGESETVIEITPVLRLEEEQISGNGKPLVEGRQGRAVDRPHRADAREVEARHAHSPDA